MCYTANKSLNVQTQPCGLRIFGPAESHFATTVFCLLVVLSAFCQISEADEHSDHNPLFHTLVQTGVTSADDVPHRLPPPIMSDGHSPSAQDATLRAALAGKPLEPYLRQSVVAPHICQLSDGKTTDEYVIRKVDYWFIAYADIEKLDAGDFSITDDSTDVTTTAEILADALEARSIPKVATKSEHVLGEAFGHLRYRLLNKVELASVGHAFVSRQPNSIVAAGIVDPRFLSDKEFPNEWRPLERNEVGKISPGEPQPYRGGGGYIKATRLATHQGALFVEGHMVLIEPIGWFRGRNQLRGKLPGIIQNQIRDVRRSMLKASQK